jgi:hypothetical protein
MCKLALTFAALSIACVGLGIRAESRASVAIRRPSDPKIEAQTHFEPALLRNLPLVLLRKGLLGQRFRLARLRRSDQVF